MFRGAQYKIVATMCLLASGLALISSRDSLVQKIRNLMEQSCCGVTERANALAQVITAMS